MEVTQINLNHCDTAQNLFWQTTTETKCDVAIIAEPYRIPPGNGNWIADKAGTAAILVCGRYPVQEVISGTEEGFVIAKINGIFFCSCYAPPRWTHDDFERMLDKLTYELDGRRPVVIGGDLNAWAVEWGSRRTNARGQSVLEALAKLDVNIANEGTTSTFHRNGRESIIDVTFCSPSLSEGLNWRVCDSYTHSDHQAIQYTVGRGPASTKRRTRGEGKQWKPSGCSRTTVARCLRPNSQTQWREHVTRPCQESWRQDIKDAPHTGGMKK